MKWMKGEGYVSQRDGGYWVGDTRVSLDSIVYAFLSGQTAVTPWFRTSPALGRYYDAGCDQRASNEPRDP